MNTPLPPLLTPGQVLELLSPEDQLEYLYREPDPGEWLTDTALTIFAGYLHDEVQWARITNNARRAHVDTQALRKAAEAWSAGPHAAVSQGLGEEYTPLSAVEATSIPWLWWPYIAKGALCMIDGDPGQGKSLLSLAVASHLSVGAPFPDQQGHLALPCAPGTSLFFAREDDLGSVVRPRVEAMGANLTRIFYHKMATRNGHEVRFSLQDLPILEIALRQLREGTDLPPALVVLDPIQAYLGPKIDINKANETRPLLEALADVAQRHDVAILCIRHAAKGGGDGQALAMMRGLGSVDFAAAARTVLYVQEHPSATTKALVCHAKVNSATKGRTLIFSKDQGCFLWEGVTRISAEDIAGSGRGPSPRERLRAAFWLERTLEGGYGIGSKDLVMQAADLDISEKSLLHAKPLLGVMSRRITGDSEGRWEWRLPPLTIISPPTSPSTTQDTLSSSSSKETMATRECSIDHPTTTQDTISSSSSIYTSDTRESSIDINTYNDNGSIEEELTTNSPIFPEGQDAQVDWVPRAVGAHANSTGEPGSQRQSMYCLCGGSLIVVEGGTLCARCNMRLEESV